MNIKRVIWGPLLSIIFLAFFVYSVSWIKLFFGFIDSQVIPASLPSAVNVILSQVPKPELTAKSAISIESNLKGDRRIIFEKDINSQFPIASLTKLMTAVVVLENYDLSQVATVNKIANKFTPVESDVELGDTFAVDNFLNIMLVGSSNRAAFTLSEIVGTEKFVELMNGKAQELGMLQTIFADPAGISPKNVSTTNNLINLAEYILENYPEISQISSIKEIHIYNFGDLKNTNELLNQMSDIVCGKTGFTASAMGCLLLVTHSPENNNYLISIVLGAEDRFLEMKNLVNWSNLMCK